MEGLLIGSLAEPLTRSLRLLKYTRIKITVTEVRTKVHYKIDTVTVELDEVNWNNVAEKGTKQQLVPDSFVSDVTSHNKQIGQLNAKKTGISGAHNQDAFLESIKMTGGEIVGPKYTDSRFPGLIEYKYKLPKKVANGPNAGAINGFKKVEKKTTYDPSILSDAKIADMSNRAAKQAENYFRNNSKAREYSVKIDGYWFIVTKDRNTGKINNAFITIPNRNIK